MIERPILFSAPMVRALLVGTKTQTRRVLQRQPDKHHWQFLPGYELKRSKIVTIRDRSAVKFCHSIPQNPQWDTALDWLLCNYGQPGDRLWVRETWKPHSSFAGMKPRDMPKSEVFYRADDAYAPSNTPWVPGIHMPRWASRILLEVTEVRVERLQDISEEDAQAEGCEKACEETADDERLKIECGYFPPSSYEHGYRLLWESINGAGSWEANPWVWCVSFRLAAETSADIGGAVQTTKALVK